MSKLIYENLSYAIIGACFEVYNELGAGFLEAVYQEALELEFAERGLPFVPQKELEIRFKSKVLKTRYAPDFICHDKIILEVKAVAELNDAHKAQVFNYLKATGFKLGLLVNFGSHPKLEYERIIR